MKKEHQQTYSNRIAILGYCTAVVYASLTLCNHTLFATSVWHPKPIDTECWSSTVAQVRMTQAGSSWYAKTSTGYVACYSDGIATPFKFLKNRQLDSIDEYVELLLSVADQDDQFKSTLMTTSVKQVATVCEKNANVLLIGTVRHEADVNNHLKEVTTLEIYDLATGDRLHQFPWNPNAKTIFDLISIENTNSFLVVYDMCVELLDNSGTSETGIAEYTQRVLPLNLPYKATYNPRSQDLYVSGSEQFLTCYSLKDHQVKWSINGQSAMRISGMVCNEQTGQLFVGYISGDLIAYDLQTGEVQKLLLHAPVGISHLAHKSEQELIVCLFNGEMHQICCDNPDCKMVYKVASSSRL